MLNFNELTETQKSVAIELIREREQRSGDNFFAEYVIDELKEECETMGIGEVHTNWDVSYSQGSGACFTSGYFDDLEKVLRHFKIWSKYRILHEQIRLSNVNTKLYSICHRYNHYNTVALECEIDYYAEQTEKQADKCEELHEELQELLRERMRTLHKDLESAYEDSITDESIIGLIEANDYQFEVDEDDVSIA